MPEMMYLKGRLLGKSKQTNAKALDVLRCILPAYYFFLGRCSVRGIVFSKTTHCWHPIAINVSRIRRGSQQKPPGWFSINYEGLDHCLQANQYSAAAVCQQPGKLNGRKLLSFLGHYHAWPPCLAPSRGSMAGARHTGHGTVG